VSKVTTCFLIAYSHANLSARSEADIRHKLFVAESDLAEQGIPSIHEVSPCSFIIAGLELEDQQ
jgi:hypothetical protein